MNAPRKSRRALALHRVVLAAALVLVEVVAARALAAVDPGALLLGGGASPAIAVFALGAFFCLRVVVFFVVPPALAVGLVALVLPEADPAGAFRRVIRGLRDRRSRNVRLGRLG